MPQNIRSLQELAADSELMRAAVCLPLLARVFAACLSIAWRFAAPRLSDAAAECPSSFAETGILLSL